MSNKAHTAAVRRIAARYGAIAPSAAEVHRHNGDAPDIILQDGRIEVETSATLAARIKSLQSVKGRRFIAVTNKETVDDALRLAAGTGIGVMDAHGEILLEAAT